MQPITVFSTKSRTKEIFTPLKPNEVTMYHCGPTVYNFLHIGNMRRFIFADLLHRMFLSNGYKVNQIINITDVGHLVSDSDEGEDKMEKGAKREGRTANEIAAFYTADFMENLKLLNINTNDTLFPKATENISEQIALIKKLEEKGFTYQISDGIYFDTSKDSAYADFAHLDLAGLQEGARVETNKEKKNISDFALWKFSPKDEQRQQEWESPWGIGFPGWHIECSAMAMKFLGETIDLHTGGIDLIPVHHTNEIAQSESATGHTFARYWMHNDFLNFGKEKMAKSGESFIRVSDLVAKEYSPLAYRYLTLLALYRTKIEFTFEALDAANTAWKRLNEFVAKDSERGTAHAGYIKQAQEAFNDDLDTPKIIALIWTMMKDTEINEADKRATIKEIDKMLGIIDPEYKNTESLSIDSLTEDIKHIIADRRTAREAKDWNKADELRDLLKQKGYELKDGKDGSEEISLI
jgi:cysteinyl-tRNA synthetase